MLNKIGNSGVIGIFEGNITGKDGKIQSPKCKFILKFKPNLLLYFKEVYFDDLSIFYTHSHPKI